MLPDTTVTHLHDRRPELFGCLKVVRAHSRATGSARAILTALATYADPDGSNARPSVPTLMRDTGLSDATVRRGLRRLEQIREIVCTKRGGGRSVSIYRITVSPVDDPVDEALFDLPQPDGFRTAALSPRQGSPVTVTGQTPHSDYLPIGTAQNRGGSTSERCSRHAGVEDPPPCHRCRTAREEHEQQQQHDRRARDEARRHAERNAAHEAARLARATAPPPEVAAAAAAEARRLLRSRNPLQSGTVQSTPHHQE